MTELDTLIAQQAKDDTYRAHSVSVDAWPSGADMLEYKVRRLVTDDRHGSLYCYVRLRCRCAKCRAASASYARQSRRRNG